jgi:hypothetical protein
MPANLVKTKADEKFWQHAKLMALRTRDVSAKAARGMDDKAKDAKLTAEKAWGLVTSYFQKLKSGELKMQAAEQVDAVLAGIAPSELVESAYGGAPLSSNIRREKPTSDRRSLGQRRRKVVERLLNPVVRAFLDGDEYAYADTNDVEVLPEQDATLSTVNEMLSYLLSLDDDPQASIAPDITIADGFEGSVNDLYEIVSQEYERCTSEQ